MSGTERLLGYYERELAYLRTAGAAFAAEHPQVAQRLELSGDESPDPHVERLLESFAFLAARIHQNIDDSTSDVAANLLEQLYPHVLRPVPSATVVRFDPDPAKINLAPGYTVAPGTSLFTHTGDGDTVFFQTTYPVRLWPLTVTSVSLQTDELGPLLVAEHGAPAEPDWQREAASVLRVRVAYPRGFAFAQEESGALRFYVRGNSDTAAQLCDLLLGETIAMRWRADAAVPCDADGAPAPVTLTQRHPVGAGLEAGQGLLPERDDTHPALRLLLEYFAFPAKFQFFDVDCGALRFLPKQAAPGAPARGEGELLFILRRKPSRPLLLDADTLQLGCTPAINLFARTAEPLRITGRQAHYKLVPDHHRQRATEIYTIGLVTSGGPAGSALPLPGYFSGGPAARPGPYWHARRVASTNPALPGSEMELTFIDPGFAPASDAAARTLVARVVCTNRHLARALDAGAALHIEDAGPVGAIRALHKPTAQVQPALDGATRWKLASQLALNQVSLLDGEHALDALRDMLALNNLTGEVAAERQIAGIGSLRSERVTRYVGPDPWYAYRQGYRVTVRLLPKLFHGSSQVLFGAVLHRFLGLFAGVNTFVELIVEDDDGREQYAWPALPVSYARL